MASSGNRPRVCLVTQWFPPEPAFVARGIAESLVDHGWEVEVLTGHPNYPTGKIYPGYGPAWKKRRDSIQGISVTRAPLFPSHDRSAFRRMVNYLSWAVSASLLGRSALRRADVALVYSSPATAAIPAAVRRRATDTPFVLVVQDLWPDSVTSSGFLSPRVARVVERVLGRFVGAMYKRSAHVIAISPGMLEVLRQRDVPTEKSSLVYNWSSEAAAPDQPGRSMRLRSDLGISDEEFVLMYAGNHGPAQALDALLEGVVGMPRERRCHLVMIGDGVSKEGLVQRASHSADRIHFLPSMPQSELFAVMREADVQCVSLADEPVFDITLPSKVQSILALGMPVLTVARGAAAEVTTRSGSGIAVNPGDVKGVSTAIERLLRSRDRLPEMGRRAREFYEQEMSSAVGGARLDAILRSVLLDRASGTDSRTNVVARKVYKSDCNN